jgi:hypothetical protein
MEAWMDLLETTICDSGTPFTIGNEVKDGTFIPGSYGFMSMTLGPECTCPNVMFYKAVIVRRGKGGKDRFEQVMLLAPIFKLPGVPLDFLIPENDGRQHFVDMSVRHTPINLSSEYDKGILKFVEEGLGINGFVGCLKAKTMFLKELDNVTKAASHPLAEKIGTAGVMQNVWPNKYSPLYTFDKNIDHLYNSGELSYIHDEFFVSPNKENLLNEIHRIEAMLMLPRIEHLNKVEMVAESALKYIMEKLKSSDGKKLKNSKELIEMTERTMTVVKDKQKFLSSLIDKRMNCIYKNRKLLIQTDNSPF